MIYAIKSWSIIIGRIDNCMLIALLILIAHLYWFDFYSQYLSECHYPHFKSFWYEHYQTLFGNIQHIPKHKSKIMYLIGKEPIWIFWIGYRVYRLITNIMHPIVFTFFNFSHFWKCLVATIFLGENHEMLFRKLPTTYCGPFFESSSPSGFKPPPYKKTLRAGGA